MTEDCWIEMIIQLQIKYRVYHYVYPDIHLSIKVNIFEIYLI